MNGLIRPIAIGVVRRGRELLVFDAYDSVKSERFHRPLGGGIEFGERAVDAVVRELLEETGSGARVLGLLGVLENLFTYEGDAWHEIAFVFEVELEDRSLRARRARSQRDDRLPGSAGSGDLGRSRRHGRAALPRRPRGTPRRAGFLTPPGRVVA